jgi:hypothetical protein
MTHLAKHLAGACAAILVAAPAARAQAELQNAPRPIATVTIVAKSPEARKKIDDLLARAQRRLQTNDVKGARDDYESAAWRLRGLNEYAGGALWSLAQVSFLMDPAPRTARLLLDAAAEAARYGDLALQARSLLEASILFDQAGLPARADETRGKLQTLLTSPYLPADVRTELTQRIHS